MNQFAKTIYEAYSAMEFPSFEGIENADDLFHELHLYDSYLAGYLSQKKSDAEVTPFTGTYFYDRFFNTLNLKNVDIEIIKNIVSYLAVMDFLTKTLEEPY